MSSYRYVLYVLAFWIILGGLIQIFQVDTNANNTLNQNFDTISAESSESRLGSIGFIWDMMTFNIPGMPNGFRVLLTSFMTISLGLSIYALIRGL